MNVALDGLERALRAGSVEAAVLQQVDPADDGVERIAQLVRHRGQEFVLDPVCPFRLEQRLVLDLYVGCGENPAGDRFGFVTLRDAASEVPSVEAVARANSKFEFEIATVGDRFIP